MSIIRIGSNEKYASGWDIAFKKSKGAAASTATKKKASPKKSSPKKKKGKK